MNRDERTSTDGATAALAWLAHPITLAALVVLVVNDHVLKAAFPGVVTGKLSDVAGLVLAPPFVATIVLLAVGRLAPNAVAAGSTAVVGIGFALAKSTATGAAAAGAAWGLLVPSSVVLADPTDLLALPALGAAWFAWHRARGRRVGGRTARLVRVCVVLPVTFLAVAATSQVWVPVAVDVLELDGQIVLGAADVTPDRQPSELDSVQALALSADGLGWRSSGGSQIPELTLHPPTPASCRPSDPRDCYRVVPGRLAIERGNDIDGWTVDWQLSTRDQARLSAHYESYTRDLLECRSVLVHEAGTGYVVVAACGRDGFARRSAAGVWQRLGFPTAEPAANLGAIGGPPPFAPVPLGVGILAAWIALAIGSELVVRGARYRIWTGALAAISILALLPVLPMFYSLPGLALLVLQAPVQLGLVIPWLVLQLQRRTLRLPVVAAAIGTGLVTSLLPYLVYFGYLPDYRWTCPAAFALGVAGIAVTAAVARASGPRDRPPPSGALSSAGAAPLSGQRHVTPHASPGPGPTAP